MTTLNLQVAFSADDADESGGDTNIVHTSPLSDATDEYLGFRWRNVTIPQGATITSATLSVVITASTSDEPDHTFWGDAADNANIFTAGIGNNDISGRTKTTASVAWANADLGSGTNQLFAAPDMATIVQEIVSRPGWASGNSLVIFCASTNGNGARDLGISMFDSNASFGATLDVVYTAAGGSGGPNRMLSSQNNQAMFSISKNSMIVPLNLPIV